MTTDRFTVFHRPDGPDSKIPTELSISNFVQTAQKRSERKEIGKLRAKYLTNVDVARTRRDYILASHHGNLDTDKREVSNEDRFAMALRNASYDDKKPLVLPGVGDLEILEYQMPLYTRRSDPFKAADLFGLVGGKVPCVVELKMPRERASSQATPMYAILQGLTYCSLIQKAGTVIGEQAGLTPEEGEQLRQSGPMLVIMAPTRYWRGFDNEAEHWRDAIGGFVASVKNKLKLEIHLIALDCDREDGKTFKLEGGVRPRLVGDCSCKPIKIGGGGVKRF